MHDVAGSGWVAVSAMVNSSSISLETSRTFSTAVSSETKLAQLLVTCGAGVETSLNALLKVGYL